MTAESNLTSLASPMNEA